MSTQFSYLGSDPRLPSSTWADNALALCTAGSLLFFYKKQMEILNFAVKEGGEVKARPTTLLSRIITPIHFIGMLFMPIIFLIAYAMRFALGIKNDIVGQWLREYSLPTADFTPQTILALQIAGVISSVWVWKATCDVFTFLGSQWHFIGRREKPKLITSGPYASVRHPLYTWFIAQGLCQMLMYWSWVPAIAFGVTLFSLVVKIPIEEDTIDQDPVIGDDYRKYKRVVPWRLIPGVW